MTTAKTIRKRSTRMERRLAGELGGRRIPLSGAGAEKGDARVGQRTKMTARGPSECVKYPLRIESKVTSGPSYAFSAKDWGKLASAALAAGENPVFHVQLTVPGVGKLELCAVPEGFAAMLGIRNKNALAGLWPDNRTVRSYTISWNRWAEANQGPFCIWFERLDGSLFLTQPHRLLVVDYADLKKALKEAEGS